MLRRNPNATILFIALTLCLALAPARLTARQQGSQDQTPRTQTTSAQTQPPAPQSPTQSPQQQATVKLSLIVTDEKGRAVEDVRREDVAVSEDGVPQTITYFARESLPVSYVIAADNSGSMRPLMETIVRTGGSFVAANKPGDETALLRFVDSDDIKLLQDFTDSREDLGNALYQLSAEGGQTALIDGVYLSVQSVADRREGDATRRRSVVLITDGDDRSSYYKLSQLQNLLHRTGVQVFVIGLTQELDSGGMLSANAREKATHLLDLIASESGGRAFYPNKVGELVEAVNQIARDMHTQYVVGYTPTNAASDGKFRKVEVSIASAPGQPKRIAFARAGYVAPGGSAKEKEGEKKKKKGEKKK